MPDMAAVVTTFPGRAVALGCSVPYLETLGLLGEWWSQPAQALAPAIVRNAPWRGSPWAYANYCLWGPGTRRLR